MRYTLVATGYDEWVAIEIQIKGIAMLCLNELMFASCGVLILSACVESIM